jgi:hypothetical protein
VTRGAGGDPERAGQLAWSYFTRSGDRGRVTHDGLDQAINAVCEHLVDVAA